MSDPNTIRNNLNNLKIEINNQLENIRTIKDSAISNNKNTIDHFFSEEKIKEYNNEISNIYDELNNIRNSSYTVYNKIIKNISDDISSLLFNENIRYDISLFIYSQLFTSYTNENEIYNFFNTNFKNNKTLESLISIIIKNKKNKKSLDNWFKQNEKKYNKFKEELIYLKKKDFLDKQELNNLFNLYSEQDLILLIYSQPEINNFLYIFNNYFGDNYNDSTISGKAKEIITNSLTQFQTHSEIISDAFYKRDTSLNLHNRVLNLFLNKTIKKIEFNISSYASMSKKEIDKQLKNDKNKIKKNMKNIKKMVKDNLNNNLSFYISDFNIRYKERYHSEYSREKIKKDLESFNEQLYNIINSDIRKLENNLNSYLDEIFNSNKSSYMLNISDDMKNRLTEYFSKNKSKFIKKFKKESDFFHQNIKNNYSQLINDKKNIVFENTKNKLNSLFLNFIYDVDKNLYFCDWSTKLYIYNLYYLQYISLLDNIYNNLSPIIDANLDLNNINNLIVNSNNQVKNQIEIDYNNIDISSIVSKSFN